MPEEWVNSVLPLKVTPSPSEVKRVFVGRFELLSGEREEALLSLFPKLPTIASGFHKVGTDELKQLKALQLGRFSAGAFERIKEIEMGRMQERYRSLEQALQKDKEFAAK